MAAVSGNACLKSILTPARSHEKINFYGHSKIQEGFDGVERAGCFSLLVMVEGSSCGATGLSAVCEIILIFLLQ